VTTVCQQLENNFCYHQEYAVVGVPANNYAYPMILLFRINYACWRGRQQGRKCRI